MSEPACDYDATGLENSTTSRLCLSQLRSVIRSNTRWSRLPSPQDEDRGQARSLARPPSGKKRGLKIVSATGDDGVRNSD